MMPSVRRGRLQQIAMGALIAAALQPHIASVADHLEVLCQKVSQLAVAYIVAVVAQLAPELEDVKDKVEKLIPDLSKLSRLGNYGALVNNMNRDLEIILHPKAVNSYTRVAIPLKLPGRSPQPRLQNLNLPRYNKLQGAWLKRVCPGSDRLEAFWNNVSNHPDMPIMERLLIGRPNWRRFCIPHVTIDFDTCSTCMFVL